MTHPDWVLAGDVPESDGAPTVQEGAAADGAAATSCHGPGQPATLAGGGHGRQLVPVRGALPLTM